MQSAEKQTTIFSQPRIERIFNKLCSSNVQVLMRVSSSSKVAIKASVARIFQQKDLKDQPLVVELINISREGIQHLEGRDKIQLEFVLISNKLVCTSTIRKNTASQVIIDLPNSLTSIERRSNERYKTLTEYAAFASFSHCIADGKDFQCPPYFAQHQALASSLEVNDISLGGLCLKLHFPFMLQHIERSTEYESFFLKFPLKKPIQIGVNVRWIKKITEKTRESDSEAIYARMYLIGCQFISVEESLHHSLKYYIKQLQEVGFV